MLQDISEIDIGVGSHGFNDGIGVVVLVLDVTSPHEIVQHRLGLEQTRALVLLNFELGHVAEEKYIDGDLRFIINKFEALFDGAVWVSISNHEIITEIIFDSIDNPLVRRESTWDACRREGSMMTVSNRDIIIREDMNSARFNVYRGHRDLSLPLGVAICNRPQEVEKRSIIQDTHLGGKTSCISQCPVLINVTIEQISPQI